MALLTRNTLKNFFKRGSFPTEVHFADLIDSTVNKIDDGLSKSARDGLLLAPQGSSKRVISFYESIRDAHPAFSMSINPTKTSKGISFDNPAGRSVLFVGKNTNVGIGTTRPRYRLQVAGMVSAEGRIGGTEIKVNADGRWHNVFPTALEGVQAYELMAFAAGRKGSGRYALTHAMALSTYGRSRNKVKQIKASYSGWLLFPRKIVFRWRGDTDAYNLQVRTTRNFGFLDEGNQKPAKIHLYIQKLWDDKNTPG